MSKVSVALCTFNGERFLNEQLLSIARQTRMPDELVICDDASTDGTAAIVRSFAATAPFNVRFFPNEANLGSTKNFEKAITHCTGDIVFLSDQDDVWLPEKIEKIESEFLASQRVGLVFSDAELVDENLRPLNETMWDHSFPEARRKTAENAAFYKTLLEGNTVTGATVAFRSKYIDDFLPVPDAAGNLIHDGWIALVVSFMSDVVFVERPLIKYRQHMAQQIGANRDDRGDPVSVAGLQAGLQKVYLQKIALDLISQRLGKFSSLTSFDAIKDSVVKNLDRVEERITHLENRLRIYKREKARWPIVVGELVSGRYGRYSNGWLSAVKDLFAIRD